MPTPRRSALWAALALLALAACAPLPPVAEVAALPMAAQVPSATPTAVVLPSATPTVAVPVATAAPSDAAPAAPPSLAPPVDPLDPYAGQLTPTPRAAGSPPRVGIQIGHWKANELPEELARFRTSTGAVYGKIGEAAVNLDIGQRVVALLLAQGVEVDLLPATVPISYTADAFVSLHADGSRSGAARGFKLATPWRTSRAAQHLHDSITAEYRVLGMPQDGSITVNMRGYYAFNNRRHQHAIARTTPAVILEMGFLTSAADRAVLLNRPDAVARVIAAGVMRYLRERDPADGAALLTPNWPNVGPKEASLVVRAGPSEGSRALIRIGAERRLRILQERDGWFNIMVTGEWRIMGWVRRDEVVVVTNEPPPPPPPSSDT